MQSDAGAGTGPGFIHRWAAGTGSGLTLLLLHGTGGDENDLIPLGRALAPHASLLSVRGKVLENGMPRFFRRVREGVFDQEDLKRRTDELVTFIGFAAGRYHFDPASLVAVGLSNGANIAASVLLRHPGAVRRAILLRPMVPFTPDSLSDLTGSAVLISSGRRDSIVPLDQPEALAAMLRDAGADVTLAWQQSGHQLTDGDLQTASMWLQAHEGQTRTDPAGW